MPAPAASDGKVGKGSGGDGDKKGRTLGSSSSGDSGTANKKDHHGAAAHKTGKKRKDGAPNKMSFDVDDLEEGLYVQVEDEEDFEEVIEYEEIPEGEAAGQSDDGAKKESEDLRAAAAADESYGYKIRPDLTQKFRPGTVQKIIERAIKDKLEGQEYSTEDCDEWVRLILEDVHEKVKSQNYRRYKIITQITLGERRGEGASSATRCLWDAEADCMATYTFLSDSIFCNGTVYGIYFY